MDRTAVLSEAGEELTVGDAIERLIQTGVLRERTFRTPVPGSGYPRWYESDWEWSDSPWPQENV